MKIQDTVAIITGAATGIGRRVALELAERGAHGLALVDEDRRVQSVAGSINEFAGDWVCLGYRGPIRNREFRRRVFEETAKRCGRVNVCVPAFGVPAAGISRPLATSDLMASLEWATEMMGSSAVGSFGSRLENTRALVFFIRLPLPTQRSSALPGMVTQSFRHAASQLLRHGEAHGVRCAVLLPDSDGALAQTPAETLAPPPDHRDSAIAKAISFMIAHSMLPSAARN